MFLPNYIYKYIIFCREYRPCESDPFAREENKGVGFAIFDY